MFAEIAKSFFEFLKLAPRYFIAFGIIAAFLLFSSEKTLKHLSVFEFAQNYRPVIGLVLIVTVPLFIVSIFTDVFTVIRNWWRERKYYREMTERLNRLTEDEKQILRYYFAKETRANTLRIDDGAVQGLVSEGIIYRSASVGNMVEGFAHNISDFAWNYLYVNLHLLEGSTNTYRTDKRIPLWQRASM